MSRRGRGRGSRRILTHIDDDLPLSFLALLTASSRRTVTKRATPKKRPSRRRGPVNISPFLRPPQTPIQTPTTSEIVTLEDTPESSESSAMLTNVHTKIGDFMKSGSFISSDEDETEMMKTKSKRPAFNSIFISDDSDDDVICDMSKPSTSAGPSTENKSHATNDDIMEIVDSVLHTTNFDNKENKANAEEEMKSLEDFRKETEKLLQDASLLLDEFKTGRKQEQPEKEKPEESPTKTTIGSCPICLESLNSRPASVTICGHIFCKECITKTAQTLKKCPTCRKSLTLKKIHPIFFN